MNEGEKRISVITLVIIIAIVIVALIVCLNIFVLNKNNEESYSEIKNIEGEQYIEYDENVKINNSELLQETKYLNNFAFNNFYVYSIDGVTKIEFDVYNGSAKRAKLQNCYFVIYDENENVAGKLLVNGDELASEQTKRLSIVVDADIANLLDIGVEPIYNNSL